MSKSGIGKASLGKLLLEIRLRDKWFLETAERLNDFMRVSLCEIYFFLGSKGIQVEEPIVYLKLLDIDPNTIPKEVLKVLSNLDVSHESDSSDNKNSISLPGDYVILCLRTRRIRDELSQDTKEVPVSNKHVHHTSRGVQCTVLEHVKSNGGVTWDFDTYYLIPATSWLDRPATASLPIRLNNDQLHHRESLQGAPIKDDVSAPGDNPPAKAACADPVESDVKPQTIEYIESFEGFYENPRRYGGNPCHLYHLRDGKCHKLGCRLLHGQIKFAPSALETYARYLKMLPCKYGSGCAHMMLGNCFYGHTVGPRHSRVELDDSPHAWIPVLKVPEVKSENELSELWKDTMGKAKGKGQTAHDAKDFLPLIQAIYRTVIKKNNTRVYRTVIGHKLRSEHEFPIGTGKYRDFKTYSCAAAEFGYVVMGTEDIQRLGREWIESTGKLEAACGVPPAR